MLIILIQIQSHNTIDSSHISYQPLGIYYRRPHTFLLIVLKNKRKVNPNLKSEKFFVWVRTSQCRIQGECWYTHPLTVPGKKIHGKKVRVIMPKQNPSRAVALFWCIIHDQCICLNLGKSCHVAHHKSNWLQFYHSIN